MPTSSRRRRRSDRAASSALVGLALTALVEHRRDSASSASPRARWRGTDLVFTTAKGGPLAGSTVVHALHRHLEAAGLPRQRFHDLRHIAATILAPKLSRAELLALFGWAEGSTPARYTHASSVSQRAADAMDEVLAPAVDEEAEAQ
jgi:integrase